MALKQLVPIEITIVGDGTSTVFSYALANLYQNGQGNSIPFGTAGVTPTSISIPNPPVAITSSTVDAYGNITITLTSALPSGQQVTLELDLQYNSGAAVSYTATQTIAIAGPSQSGNAPVNVSVGTSSSVVLAANSSRAAVILTNVSSNNIFLAFGSNSAVVNSGVPLYPQGTLILDVNDNVQQAITAIASAASSGLAIQEFNR